MKKEKTINYVDSNVKCSCGTEFAVKSTKEEFQVEVCSNCHPFYTGQQGKHKKTGNIEKFNRKFGIEK